MAVRLKHRNKINQAKFFHKYSRFINVEGYWNNITKRGISKWRMLLYYFKETEVKKMSLYNSQGRRKPKITPKAILKILLENTIGLYAEAHSDRYNSREEFMGVLYDEIGTDEAEMKELGIDLTDIW